VKPEQASKSDNADADPPAIWGRLHKWGSNRHAHPLDPQKHKLPRPLLKALRAVVLKRHKLSSYRIVDHESDRTETDRVKLG
jgi:hypothetical protein